MMTSSFEGFGITLTEAQQFGCVPIVQNTYASLTDIIQDGVNGVIIDDSQEERFAQQLAKLMRDSQRRKRMAQEGLKSCQKFSQEKITQKWIGLFNKLLAE